MNMVSCPTVQSSLILSLVAENNVRMNHSCLKFSLVLTDKFCGFIASMSFHIIMVKIERHHSPKGGSGSAGPTRGLEPLRVTEGKGRGREKEDEEREEERDRKDGAQAGSGRKEGVGGAYFLRVRATSLELKEKWKVIVYSCL